MNYSTTYIAIIVNALSFLLPKLGVTLGNDELTVTVQTLLTLGTGVWVLVQRHKQGDVTAGGFRK